jgi:hypothetical protein
MSGVGRPFRATLLLGMALGCGHGEPFTTVPTEPLGPPTELLPRRLTYNTRPDRTPSVFGDTIVYTRVDADRADGDGCLALLPLEGGTLYHTVCARGALADSVRDSWLYPAISPDGRRIAFVRERLVFRAGNLLERALVVAPLAAPDSAVVVVAGYAIPGGEVASGYRKVTWSDDQTLWFLGGFETSGPATVEGFAPYGVFAVTLAGDQAGVPEVVPDLSFVRTYARGDDGTVYFVPSGSTAVHRLVAGAASELVAQFTGTDEAPLIGLTDLAASGGVVTVIGTLQFPEAGAVTQLFVADVAGGTSPRVVPLAVTPQRLAGVPGRARVLVESGGDLWLVAVR